MTRHSPIAIQPVALALLVDLGETFVDGAPDQQRYESALDHVRSELEGAGHTVAELLGAGPVAVNHAIIEASETLDGKLALTIVWDDQTETVEIVGKKAARALGYRYPEKT